MCWPLGLAQPCWDQPLAVMCKPLPCWRVVWQLVVRQWFFTNLCFDAAVEASQGSFQRLKKYAFKGIGQKR